ncbi:MAG: hypothetical protein ACLU38_10630, partial [Dysosmobacter sp.]
MDGLHRLLSQRLLKGEPRIPEHLQPNSMCLLTERPKGCSEAERRIVGAFMVEDDFIGTCCTDRHHSGPSYPSDPAAAGTPAPLLALCGQGAGKSSVGAKRRFKYMSNRTGEKILFDCKENTLTADEKSR